MFWNLWPSKPANNADSKKDTQVEIKEKLRPLESQLDSIPPHVRTLISYSLVATSAIGGLFLYRRYVRRINNADWVTPDLLAKKRWIRGVVTSVGDADNFRLFHTPPFGGWRRPFKFRTIPTGNKELKDRTLHIRIAGVDAPEASHFGKPEQPHAAESLAWLRHKILGKSVYCQLLRRDQYSRVVANVYLSPRFLPGAIFHGKSLPLLMLRSGHAAIYDNAGTEYGPEGKDVYLQAEKAAQAARLGMWAHGVKGVETPGEFKQRHRSPSSELDETSSASKRNRGVKQASGGWLSQLFKSRQ